MIQKRPYDEREYKAMTLSNDMRVLLVSDPASSRAAAALDVHVGAYSDPPNVSVPYILFIDFLLPCTLIIVYFLIIAIY